MSYPTRPGCVLGVDLSTYQGLVDWHQLADAGVRWAIHKASEGLNWRDTRWITNATNARGENRIEVVGAYHFFHPADDPKVQARLLWDSAHVLATGIPAIDFETFKGSRPSQSLVRLLECLAETEALWGTKPLVYTAPYIMAAVAADRAKVSDLQQLSTYPLWIAQWGVKQPSRLNPWGGWLAWQFDGDKGLTMPCGRDADFNWLNGEDVVELLGWAGR